jgi:hypothetical protein
MPGATYSEVLLSQGPVFPSLLVQIGVKADWSFSNKVERVPRVSAPKSGEPQSWWHSGTVYQEDLLIYSSNLAFVKLFSILQDSVDVEEKQSW